MDGVSIFLGLALGVAIGGAIGWVGAESRARARAAQELSKLPALLEAAEKQIDELRNDIKGEREQAKASHALAAAWQQKFKSKEESFSALQQSIDDARKSINDQFAATGAEVLRRVTEQWMLQASEKFASQQKLGQSELDARKQQIDDLFKPLREQLTKHENLTRELDLKRERDSQSVKENLATISDLQQSAINAANTLKGALSNSRQRGRWGEIALQNIVTMSGLSAHVDFVEQASTADESGARLIPDLKVRLPGGRFVPVDSKVPMEAYLTSLREDLTDEERERHRAAHAKALRSHVKMLASKEYAKALGGGSEVTLLFVPYESSLIAAFEVDGSIYNEALDAGVIVCTPATLLAVLRTCATYWQQASVNENARKIGHEAKELHDRIVKFASDLRNLGTKLTEATKIYNTAVGSFNGRLLPKARDTAKLAGNVFADQESKLQDLLPVDTSVRDVIGGQPTDSDTSSGP